MDDCKFLLLLDSLYIVALLVRKSRKILVLELKFYCEYILFSLNVLVGWLFNMILESMLRSGLVFEFPYDQVNYNKLCYCFSSHASSGEEVCKT